MQVRVECFGANQVRWYRSAYRWIAWNLAEEEEEEPGTNGTLLSRIERVGGGL